MSGNLKALLVGGPMYDPYQQIPNYFSQRKGRGKMPRPSLLSPFTKLIEIKNLSIRSALIHQLAAIDLDDLTY